MGHAGVGWGGVGHAGWGVSCRGGVGHVGVGGWVIHVEEFTPNFL